MKQTIPDMPIVKIPEKEKKVVVEICLERYTELVKKEAIYDQLMKEKEIIMRLSMADEEENSGSIKELTEELMNIQKMLKNR